MFINALLGWFSKQKVDVYYIYLLYCFMLLFLLCFFFFKLYSVYWFLCLCFIAHRITVQVYNYYPVYNFLKKKIYIYIYIYFFFSHSKTILPRDVHGSDWGDFLTQPIMVDQKNLTQPNPHGWGRVGLNSWVWQIFIFIIIIIKLSRKKYKY